MNLLEALRYLAALAQHQHFGRAALACHITQPALSNAIRALEAQMGVTLVRRSRQYEGLTPEGELALAHAHRLLHEAEALRQALAGRAGAPQGRLQLGAVPTAMPIAARFAARLRSAQPGLVPVLRSLSSPELDAGLDNLSLDLALGYSNRPEVRGRGLVLWPQYEERYFVVQRAVVGLHAPPGPAAQGPSAGAASAAAASAAAATAFGAPITWLEAGALPLVMLTPEMHNRQLLDQAFLAAGCRPDPALETNSVLALLVALQAPTLAAVLPGALVDLALAQPGLCARPLQAPELLTPIAFLTSAAGRPTLALQAALALAQQARWMAEVAAHSGALGAGTVADAG